MKNDNNIESFDSLFKESLGNAGSPVPPGVWEGIAGATTGGAAVGTTSIIGKLLGWKGVALIGGAALVTTVVLTTPVDEPSVEPNNQTATEVVIDNDAETSANQSDQNEPSDASSNEVELNDETPQEKKKRFIKTKTN